MDVIDEFLEIWKTRSRDYYDNLRKRYYEIKNDTNPEPLPEKEMAEWNGGKGMYFGWTEVKFINNRRLDAFVEASLGGWHSKIRKIVTSKDDVYDVEITKLINKEAERKKEAFIKRIEKFVGTIENVNLEIGMDGEINGFVEGSKGKASVRTIGAGGYNIQRYHYRVLVKKIKE